jgi:putative SOS response-associated peptidase YedK
MCERFIADNQAAVECEFSIVKPLWSFMSSYNVAPNQAVPMIGTVDGERIGLMLRWGVIPFFAKGVPPKAPYSHAPYSLAQRVPRSRATAISAPPLRRLRLLLARNIAQPPQT